VTLQTTVPGSDLSFYKIDYRGQRFFPVSERTTLRLHGALGYGDGYGSTDGLPFYENYFAGGFGSVRGFRSGSLGPRAIASLGFPDAPGGINNPVNDPFLPPNFGCNPQTGICTNPDQDDLPFGGNVLTTGGVDLLFPLPFIKDQRDLRTVLFLDVGNVFDSNCGKYLTDCYSPEFGELASSVGVGLTWITAMGPLGFSLATPIMEPDGADTQFFQFTLGQTF
jgi:outer membrane protein insertion porin family